MASESAHFYAGFFQSALSKEVDVTSDTFKLLLTDSSYTPNQDTHRYLDDITGEVSGDGYTSGGKTIENVTISYDSSSNRIFLKGGDLEWPDATFTTRRGIVYDDTPSSDKPLVLYVDFGEDKSPSAGKFSITWQSDGMAYVEVD